MSPSTRRRRTRDESSPPAARASPDEDVIGEAHGMSSQRDVELQRKRARDRKSQQAMRDRTKWTINALSEQVAVLSSALDQRVQEVQSMDAKLGFLETENAQLREQNAALQLSLMGHTDMDSVADSAAQIGPSPAASASSLALSLWELYPNNNVASCLADQILQGFVDTVRSTGMAVSSPGEKASRFPLKPNLCSLMDKDHRSDDDISNVVADVLRTYQEIESLPKQVAVFYVMATLLKWMVLLDEQSWELMPEWLRPVPSQLSTPHSAWIDRIPWPRAREYLIAHPEITLDDFAAPYSSGFKLNWPYDPSSVLLAASVNGNGTAEIAINPVYEEHVRQIRHWTVGEAFRHRFPELTNLIDLDSGQMSKEICSKAVTGFAGERAPATCGFDSTPHEALLNQFCGVQIRGLEGADTIRAGRQQPTTRSSYVFDAPIVVMMHCVPLTVRAQPYTSAPAKRAFMPSRQPNMQTQTTLARPIRIGGASGGFTDRVAAISRLAKDPDVDAVVGDWLSENVMTGYGAAKARQYQETKSLSLEERKKTAQYASTFLQCFEPAIPHIAQNRAKLVVNAGASDTELLAEVVKDMVQRAGVDLKIAWVEGDDVTYPFLKMLEEGREFKSLTDGRTLEEWGHKPICAQAYLGSLGIAESLQRGADIVICGRVSDAAPTIGLAAWWHNWKATQLDELAGALIAGHLIECSVFVTGGYYSRFKELMRDKKHLDLGFPIAEISVDGSCTVTKEKNSNGVVNVETVTAQLVYEISGPLYFNSDVVASLEEVSLQQVAEDTVRVTGVRGLPPPPTTRVGVTAHGGYQAEWHFYLVGLDIEEKCRWMEEQARYAIGDVILNQFTTLRFHVHGTSPDNPINQEIATVDFRIFAQAKSAELFDGSKPDGFARKLYETVLQSCPGVSRPNDLRQSTAKSYWEYFVTTIAQSACKHRVHLLYEPMDDSAKVLPIPLPPITQNYGPQKSYETSDAVSLESFGATTMAPLGYIALSRSGDKASDANIGLFIAHDADDEQWHWLRSLMTIDRLKDLLGPLEYSGGRIDRFEMKNIRAVHFLLKDHLDRGYNSGSKLDTLAKNLGEYIRAKHVPVPVRFLERGHL